MDPIINHRKIKGMIKLVKKAAMAFAAGNVPVSYTHLDVYKRQLSVMERSMTKCQKKNEMKKGGTAKAAF